MTFPRVDIYFEFVRLSSHETTGSMVNCGVRFVYMSLAFENTGGVRGSTASK